MKFNQLTTAQKRGALLLLVGIVLLLGWRWRVASQAGDGAGIAAVPATDSVTTATKAAPKVYVDLNSADTAALKSVKGIGPSYARRIVRFREVYGGFVDPEQLISALGLEPSAYLRIEPQVYADTTTAAFAALRQAARDKQARLKSYTAQARPAYSANKRQNGKPFSNNNYPQTENEKSTTTKENTSWSSQPTWEKRPAPTVVDLNQADSTALDALPGIGPRTAQEIVKFRKSVYFFHDVEQVAGLWCVRPENFEKMAPYLRLEKDLSRYPHVQINTGNVEELAAHRFIRFKEARQIVAYREQHGPFASWDDLSKMLGIQSDFWDKLGPYIQF